MWKCLRVTHERAQKRLGNTAILPRKLRYIWMSTSGCTRIRITLVGDGMTGKTSLLDGYKNKKCQEYHIPTVFDSYSMTVPIGGTQYIVVLSEVTNQEIYERLKPITYPETDVFVICYAVDNKTSFRSVERKWYQEVKHYKQHSKVVLVATKIDLRDEIEHCVTTQEGEELRHRLQADKFVECSSKTMRNVKTVFSEAMCCHLPSTTKKNNNSSNSSCCLT